MNVRKLALPFLALPLLLAACDGGGGGGEVDDRLPIDPNHFVGQQFECGTPGTFPSCPPSFCTVDINGQVVECEMDCSPSSSQFFNCTAFDGPPGVELCAPFSCSVAADGSVTCDFDTCADEPVTCYDLDRFENTCG